MFERYVESVIRDAMDRGTFRAASRRGKRIDLSTYFETPEDIRVAQSILRNAGVLPVEIELRRDLNILRQELHDAASPGMRASLERNLRDLCLKVDLLRESRAALVRRR